MIAYLKSSILNLNSSIVDLQCTLAGRYFSGIIFRKIYKWYITPGPQSDHPPDGPGYNSQPNMKKIIDEAVDHCQ